MSTSKMARAGATQAGEEGRRAGPRRSAGERRRRRRARGGDAARDRSRAGRSSRSRVFILSGVGFLYFVLPKLAGVGTTLHRIEGGDSWWIAVGVVLELLSFAGYVVLFRAVFVRDAARSAIGWRESYQITMAGLVATRLFAAAGAGGVALTAWALRALGHGAAAGRLPDGRVPGAAVRRLRRLAADRRHRPRDRACSPAAARSRSRSCPAIVAAVLFARGRRDGAAARRPRAPARALGVGLRARSRTGSPARSTVPALAASGVRTAIDADPHPRPRPARRARLVGLRHLRAVGDVPRVRLAAAVHRDLDGLLRRHARQPAAAARRPRRRRGRHDRRVRRLRRATSTWRCSRCSPTARSPSGCRRCRASWPTSSCAARSRAGATKQPRLRRERRASRARLSRRVRCRAHDGHAHAAAMLYFTK